MKSLIQFLLNGLAVWVTAYLLPGVEVHGVITALIVALVLALTNMFVKPLLILFTLPLTVATLGLFLLVINAVVILIVDALIPDFHVDGFWWALAFSLILSLINSFFTDLTRDKKE